MIQIMDSNLLNSSEMVCLNTKARADDNVTIAGSNFVITMKIILSNISISWWKMREPEFSDGFP